MLDVLLTKFKGSAVIPLSIDAFKTAGGSLVQYKNLPSDGSVFSGYHGFTVQLDEMGSLFDKPVYFGGGNEMIRGDSYKERLTAAFLGQKNFTRGQVRMHGDGMGALKIIDR